jgi:hypothetical protein
MIAFTLGFSGVHFCAMIRLVENGNNFCESQKLL